MKQQLLWVITGLLLGASSLATAQRAPEQTEQTVKDKPSDTLKVGVSVEVRGAYDFRNYYAVPDFGPATIPMKGDVNNSKRFLFDIPSASLSIEKELPLAGGEAVKLVVQANLKKELALKSVYADFKGFRIGKSMTNFCDPDACDLVGGRFVQARWQHQLNTSFSYAVAIEEAPDLVIYPEIKKEDRAKQNLQPHKNIPAISANVRCEQKKLWHVQVSGLVKSLEYRNKKTAADFYMPAWGVNVGAALHLVPEKTTLKIQGVYGQGIGSYMADLGDLEKEVNTVYAKKNNASVLKTLDSWGVGCGLAHKWLPKLSSEAAYRFLDTQSSQRDDNAYKYGHAASVGLFYHPTEQIKVGTEYLFGARENINGKLKNAHRMQAMVGIKL